MSYTCANCLKEFSGSPMEHVYENFTPAYTPVYLGLEDGPDLCYACFVDLLQALAKRWKKIEKGRSEMLKEKAAAFLRGLYEEGVESPLAEVVYDIYVSGWKHGYEHGWQVGKEEGLKEAYTAADEAIRQGLEEVDVEGRGFM